MNGRDVAAVDMAVKANLDAARAEEGQLAQQAAQ